MGPLGHSTDAIASCSAEPRAYTSVTADCHCPLTAERLLAARAIRMNVTPAITTRARISHSQAGVLVLVLPVDVGDGVARRWWPRAWSPPAWWPRA